MYTFYSPGRYNRVLLLAKPKCYYDMECSCSHKGIQVYTMECCCWQDRDVIRTRECCCEPIKMNLAMVICTICMGGKQRHSTDLQTLLVRGKRFQFYLLQNFELPPQYIQNFEIFWGVQGFRNFELINTGCSLPCTI